MDRSLHPAGQRLRADHGNLVRAARHRPTVEVLEGRQLLSPAALAHPLLSPRPVEVGLGAHAPRAAHHHGPPTHPAQHGRIVPPTVVPGSPSGGPSPAQVRRMQEATHPHLTVGNILGAIIAVPVLTVAGLFHRGI